MRARTFCAWATTLALALVVSSSTPVAAADDVTGPTLSGVTINPTAAQNITNVNRTVDVRVQLADPAGIEGFCVRIDTPAPFPMQPFAIECANWTSRISGTEFDGVFRVPVVFPAKSHTGSYPIGAVFAIDKLGNTVEYSNADLVAAGYTTSITIIGTADLTPPVISQVSLTPSVVDVSRQPVGVTVRAHVKEIGTDLEFACLDFGAPDAPDELFGSMCLFGEDAEGTTNDGFYSFEYLVDETFAPGSYPILGMTYSDRSLNGGVLTPAELAAAGTPTELTVLYGGTLVPLAPRNVGANAVSATIGGVSWTAPVANGGPAISQYTVTASPGGAIATAPGNATSAFVPGLMPSTNYTFTVQATNADGTGAPSAPSNLMRTTASVVGVPDAPSSVVATPGNGSADVSWVPPNANGNALTDFFVFASPGNRSKRVAANTSGTVMPDLVNGVSYTFSVVARNANGTGPSSAPSNAVTPGATPSAPTNVIATPGDESVKLTWTAPADNGSPILRYRVTGNPEIDRTFEGNPTSVTIDGLVNGQTYNFRVQAINAIGPGALSTQTPTVKAVGKPKPRLNVTATAGDGSAHVTWSPTADGGSPITGHRITASPGGVAVDAPWYANDVTVSGLTNGTSYTFTVVAKNALGDSQPSAPSNTVTPSGKPSTPAGVTATAGDGSAQVTWLASVNNGSAITGYTITASPGGASATVAGNQTSTAMSGLTNGVAYTFTVRATNAIGDSAASSPSNAVTPNAIVVETGLPLVAMAGPGPSVGLSRTIAVKWVGADISGIDHFDIRRRSTPWNGSPGAWSSWKSLTTATSAADTGTYGRTYCYSARAQDGVGNLSNWSPSRCTVIPINSDQLLYSTGWKRSVNAGAFAGFNRYTKTKGAKMTRTGIVAKSLSLVTTKCPTCGRVEVRWNGQLLKTFNLAATTTARRQVLNIANWSTAKKGTLTVTNVSASGKQVNIEGVAIYNG